MNTKHAQLVLTILEEGSITAAAKALGLTQPTLSQTLKQIERHFGDSIFDRSSTPIALTMAGELYVQAARRILKIESQLAESLETLHGQVSGTLRVGMTVKRSSELLPQILPDFFSAYPQVRIEIIEGRPADLENMLIEDKLDVALFEGNPANPQLTYRLITTQEMVLIAGKNTSIAQRIPSGTTINLIEAQKERFVLPAPYVPERELIDQLLSLHGMNVTPLVTTDNIITALRLTTVCSAVMLCPYISLLCDPASMQKLSHYHLSDDSVRPSFFMAMSSDAQLSPHAESFFNILSNRFRAMMAYRP